MAQTTNDHASPIVGPHNPITAIATPIIITTTTTAPTAANTANQLCKII